MDPLEARVDSAVLGQAFPGADSIGDVTGMPPHAPVLADGEVVGHVMSTHNTVGSIGFAGDTFDIVVGLRNDSTIAGTALLEHYEPIIGPSAIRADAVQNYLDTLSGPSLIHI